MPLQSCATIEFVLDEHKEVLSLDDLEIDSPHNTYKNSGLPPGTRGTGPFFHAGGGKPSESRLSLFCSQRDGAHVFTKTYSEHLNAQNKIQKNK